MADKYNYKKFDYAGYINENKDKLNQMSNQLQNFDQTYDHTKDASWIAADEQLKKDARIAGANAVGRMGNRIGAISTSMQNASDSIYADALKNSQNLIGTYRDAAYNKLLNQYNLLNQQEQQNYNRWADERDFKYNDHTNEQNFNYQEFLRDLNGGSTGSTGTSTSGSIPSYILNQLELIDNDDDLKRRVKGLVESGAISVTQGDGLLAAYGLFSGQNTASSPQVVGPTVGFNYYDKKSGKTKAVK